MTRPSTPISGSFARKAVIAVAIFLATFTLTTQIRAFIDRRTPLPGEGGASGRCGIWFVGSSTIARWDGMQSAMAPWKVENRGVGGALIDQIQARFALGRADRSLGSLVLLVGDNDLAAGVGSVQVAGQTEQLVRVIRARLPQTQIIVLSVKPSPARWALRADQLRLLSLLRQKFASWPNVSLADVGTALLVGDHPGPYYLDDGVHLDTAGYQVWGAAVRQAVERGSKGTSHDAATCAN